MFCFHGLNSILVTDFGIFNKTPLLLIEARPCAKPHKNLEALKRSLTREWDRITPAELRPIAENFIKRLRLCIGAKGGHFEEK
ncbi:unnamed protein product, partial [Mesorhabditis belari]|uniref:Uncharacterized protein n=1 Tax=Mesorhabditis belari TaxID=2138241 RepID=A0AAF3FK51_9BILA